MHKPNEYLRTEIAIRAYSEDPARDPVGTRPPSPEPGPSPWTLVFDCETTIGATQRLRFGFYQIRLHEALEEEGIFYDPRAITAGETVLLSTYAAVRDLKLLTIDVFRSEIFIKYGYTRCGTVVGFNLPFDISRIAIDHGPARRNMRGGLSFEISRNGFDPRVRVKHLSPRAALIDFATPGDQDTGGGIEKSWVQGARLSRSLCRSQDGGGSLAEPSPFSGIAREPSAHKDAEAQDRRAR